MVMRYPVRTRSTCRMETELTGQRARSAMNRLSWLDAGGAPPELLWEDGERRFCTIWRNGADGARQAYMAVLPAAEHPTPGFISRLANEYALKEYIDGAWALRPLELVREHGRTVLVLDTTTASRSIA